MVIVSGHRNQIALAKISPKLLMPPPVINVAIMNLFRAAGGIESLIGYSILPRVCFLIIFNYGQSMFFSACVYAENNFNPSSI